MGSHIDRASNHLLLTELDYSVETKNVLAKAAAWLLKPEICREIERRAVIDVPKSLDQLRNEVNAEVGKSDRLPRRQTHGQS